MLTSSMATASYLAKHQPLDKRRVFVIGEEGLRATADRTGFRVDRSYMS